jgi:F-type H+-transporting ATPase subunit b
MKKYFSIIIISLALFSGSAFTVRASVTTAPAVNQATEEKATNAETGTTEEAAAAEEHEDTGIVGMFGLNWKLFLAQLLNFGIVLFVLWKWVFKPVTSGLSARTEKIENSLQEAEKIGKDRADFDSWKQEEISTVRTEATAIISQAKQAAESLKAETLKITTEEQNRIMEQAKVRLEQEKGLMINQAKAELADIVVAATSKILKSKIDPVKDKQLIDDALKQAQS